MHEIRVAARSGSYPVLFSDALDRLLGALAEDLRSRAVFAVVDASVWALHHERMRGAFDRASMHVHVLTLEGGESAKTFATFERVCVELGAHAVERSAILLGVGGGSITDLAGFCASTFLRGIDWIAVPTSLLGMVDASIGGKTGLNLGAKNVLGTFHPPRAVLADWTFLGTLPRRELVSGLAEVVKCAVIRDRTLFDDLASATHVFDDAGRSDVREAMLAAARVKATIVSEDETEKGTRALLNFGHTVGHALEAATSFTRWTHGEAVAIGMCAAAELSREVAGLPADERDALAALLARLGLPTSDPATELERVVQWMELDKKGTGRRPRFVLTPRIGSATFGHQISQPIVNRSLARFFAKPDR